MLYMDTFLEVYPGYQRHRTAVQTVARFLDMEIWRVAETLSYRIKSNHRPRMVLVVPGNLTNKKSPNNSKHRVTSTQTAVVERA